MAERGGTLRDGKEGGRNSRVNRGAIAGGANIVGRTNVGKPAGGAMGVDCFGEDGVIGSEKGEENKTTPHEKGSPTKQTEEGVRGGEP